VGADPGKLRIGVRVPSAITPSPDPEAFAAVDATVRALTELGHHVDELPQAPFDDAALAREFLLAWFVYTAWELDEANRLTGAGDEKFERVGDSTAEDRRVRSAGRVAARCRRAAQDAYRPRAALHKIVDDMVDKNLGWVPYTQLANLTGRPAITLPLRWTAAGVPLVSSSSPHWQASRCS
jgi:Asp-tRNA(Asn)/Glu-tRNA(Gln) amidotransferase A subunit family amidase